MVFSTDWGHAREGDTDSYTARPDIVEECIRQHRLGSIITICWHAVPPTADEPVTFRPLPGTATDSLSSVQGQMMDEQFKDVLTPGTELYKRWCAQVDTVAYYLRKLQDADVPVLWRPYHEMNGNWFWWGGRLGEYSTKALYRQLFDRYVNHHKLKNLIWVWSVDRPHNPDMYFSNYYPGNGHLDILSLDVYRRDFNQAYYDSLVVLSQGKPVVLAEVGNPPAPAILDNQPKWGFYVTWAGMVRNTLKSEYEILRNDSRILGLEDSAYVKVITPYRSACGLPQLTSKKEQPADFSGEWIFNEEKSILDDFGVMFIPYKLEIIHKGNDIAINSTRILEYADDEITEEKMTLDSTEYESEFWNSPLIKTATLSDNGKKILFTSRVILQMGDNKNEIITNEIWSLNDFGETLSLEQSSTSFWGKREITLIYDKR